jgi:ribosomal protein S18 acetylase RimI-like enzyme
VSEPTYRVIKWAPGYDLGAFDCGEAAYNDWLCEHAATSAQSGICAVYLLLEETENTARMVGYYAIAPTQVVRAVPGKLARGWPQTVPAWKLAKLAVHVALHEDESAEWGRQLLREALERIVTVADAGGGKVIVVDADNAGLLGFYLRNGFKSTGVAGDLSLYMKVSTARRVLFGR